MSHELLSHHRDGTLRRMYPNLADGTMLLMANDYKETDGS